MAKRYKETKKKNKKNKKKIILCIIICLIIFVVFFYNFNFNKSDNKEEKELEGKAQVETRNSSVIEIKNNSLQGNVLKIGELKEEVSKKIEKELEGIPLTKVTYKMKSIEEGTIELEYYQETEIATLIVVQIDIKTKKIVDIQKQKDNINKIHGRTMEIVTNCDEDIIEDFKLKEKDLEEEMYVNIIVTETEIVINMAEE